MYKVDFLFFLYSTIANVIRIGFETSDIIKLLQIQSRNRETTSKYCSDPSFQSEQIGAIYYSAYLNAEMIYVPHTCTCTSKYLCFVKNLNFKNPYIQNFLTLGLSKIVFPRNRHGDSVTDSDPPQCSAHGSASYEHQHSVHKAPLYHTLLCEYMQYCTST